MTQVCGACGGVYNEKCPHWPACQPMAEIAAPSPAAAPWWGRWVIVGAAALLIVLAIWASKASAEERPVLTKEYANGFCAGWNMAVERMIHNRDHWRELIGAPRIAHEDIIRWIYSRPWRDEGAHRTAPRRLVQPPGEPEVGPSAIDAVDLYVLVPPRTRCLSEVMQ